jgi:hypothetical protein
LNESIGLKNEITVPIVLVYLGKRVPSYVYANVDYLCKRLPKLQIVLLVDKDRQVKNKLKHHPMSKVLQIDSELSTSHIKTEGYHDLTFRNGYWRHTIQRIIAALDFQISNALQKMLHIEADVIIMENFPFEKVYTESTIIWGYYNETRDVGSLISIPSLEMARWLKKKIMNTWEENPGLTDMEILRKISSDHPTQISYWPSGLSIAPNDFSKAGNEYLENIKSREIDLNGIVDVAVFGMWLCGMDPSSNYGLQRYFSKMFVENGDSIVDPSHVDYAFGSDDSILVRSSNKTESIYTLHNHSKDTRYFKASRVESLHRNYRKYIRRGTPYQTFSPKVFQILVFRKFHKIIKNSLKRKATKYD